MKKPHLILLMTSFAALAAPVQAANYAINFREASGDGAIDVTTAQYGVQPSQWTNVSGNNGGPAALLGLPGATVSWTSANTWRNTGGPTEASKGYLDDNGLTINLSGLMTAFQTAEPGATGYTLQVLYSSGDATAFLPAGLNGTAGVFSAGPGDGNNVSRTELSGSSPFQSAENALITGANRITTQRGSIAAVIISPIPEPGSAVLGLAALAATSFRRRRRNAV